MELKFVFVAIAALAGFIALLAGLRLARGKIRKEIGLLKRHLRYKPPPPPSGYTLE